MRTMITPMVKNILIINVVVFVLGIIFKSFPIDQYFALHYFESPLFQPIQLFTYMFLHANFWHIFGNMLSLFFFGPMLEAYWGAKRFLFFWIFCGLGGAIIYSGTHHYELQKLISIKNSFIAEPSFENLVAFERQFGQELFPLNFKEAIEDNPTDPILIAKGQDDLESYIKQIIDIPVLGASGAVFGILLAFGMLFPNTELMLLFFPFPIKAKYFVLFYGAFELYMGVARVPGDNIAHFAHLGGAFFGFILIKYWQKQRNTFY